MKALSIKQPWLYAVVHGGKDIENRSSKLDTNKVMRFRVITHLALLMFTCASVVGCCPNPTRIHATPVSVVGYQNGSCAQLCSLYEASTSQLLAEERDQRIARRNDAWSIAIVGMPLARMSGANREDQISQLKGQLIAIDSVYVTNHCPGILVGRQTDEMMLDAIEARLKAQY